MDHCSISTSLAVSGASGQVPQICSAMIAISHIAPHGPAISDTNKTGTTATGPKTKVIQGWRPPNVRQPTFSGRHPWITFVFGPVAVVPVLFVSLIAGPCGAMWLIAIIAEQIWGTWPEAPLTASEVEIEQWSMGCFDAYVRFAPFAVATL